MLDAVVRLVLDPAFQSSAAVAAMSGALGVLAFAAAGWPAAVMGALWRARARQGRRLRSGRREPSVGLVSLLQRLAVPLGLVALAWLPPLRPLVPAAVTAGILLAYAWRGAGTCPAPLLLAMRSLGAGPGQLALRVVLPWSTPSVMGGARAAAAALILICALAGARAAATASGMTFPALLPAALVLFGMAAVPVDLAMAALSRRVASW